MVCQNLLKLQSEVTKLIKVTRKRSCWMRKTGPNQGVFGTKKKIALRLDSSDWAAVHSTLQQHRRRPQRSGCLTKPGTFRTRCASYWFLVVVKFTHHWWFDMVWYGLYTFQTDERTLNNSSMPWLFRPSNLCLFEAFLHFKHAAETGAQLRSAQLDNNEISKQNDHQISPDITR